MSFEPKHQFNTALLACCVFVLGACGQQEESTAVPESEAASAPEPVAATPAVETSATLAEQLMARQDATAKRAPPERLQAAASAIAEVAGSGIVENAKNTGDKAPEFTLPNAVGESVNLYDELEKGPVILTWYRGSWCPYCNIQLHDYQKSLGLIESAGAQLIAISPEVPDSALSWQEKNELEFVVLSDAGNKVAHEYGIVFRLADSISDNYKAGGRTDLTKYNGDDSLELPLAVTYVIARDGTIEYAFVDADYRKRAETNEVVAFVQGMQ